MKLNYIKSQSSIRPDLIDTTSSQTCVYLRKNIIENTVENDGEITTIYEYDEAKLTKAEYEKYLNELAVADIEQQRADIDYIAMMCNVDLSEGLV